MNPMIQQNLRDRLRRHVRCLAGDIGERNVYNPDALTAAEHYIRDALADLGYEVARQPTTAGGVTSANLEATLPGTDLPDEIILIGAHYDTVPGSPGADDNGSAVAALLELAGLHRESASRRTIRFVAFTNEEPPFFATGAQGSGVYARAARRRGDDIRLMMSLEMLGYYRSQPGTQRYPPFMRWFYPDRGDFIALVSDFRSRRRMRRFAGAFREASGFPLEHAAMFSFVPGAAWSDHLSFWRSGYRAFMVTDTAFFRNPYYHTPQDTPDKLDYGRLADVTRGLSGALQRLADAATV